MSRCICHPAHRCGRCVAPVCAVCAKDIDGTPHKEPFGRNKALVDVCETCTNEHPRSGRYAYGDNKGDRSVDRSFAVSRHTLKKAGQP